MGAGSSIALIVIGLAFTLGGGASSSFFQGRSQFYNGCGNILGQIGSDLIALTGGGNICINLQNAIAISQIGLYIGVFMMIGGIIASTINLARRCRRHVNLGYST